MAERLAVEMRVKLSTVGLKTEFSKLQKYVNANFKLNIPTNINVESMANSLKQLNTTTSGAMGSMNSELSTLNSKSTEVANSFSSMNEVVTQMSIAPLGGDNDDSGLNVIKTFDWRGIGKEILGMGLGLGKMALAMGVAKLASNAFNISMKALSKAFASYREIQSQLSEIEIVTEGSLDLDRVLVRSAASASRLGLELSELLTISAEVGRAMNNLSLETLAVVSENAALLSSITNLSASDAIGGLITINKTYGIALEDSLEVVDKLVKVSNNYAVTAGDLSSALNKSAASAVAAGVEFDFLLGMITAISESTQQGGDAVGNSLKTIITRLRTNTQSLAQLQKVGVEVYGSDGQLRSAQDILTDLNKVWGDLTENQRTNIGVAISGQRQTTVFNALMSNFVTTTEAQATALGSLGSSYKALEAKSKNIDTIMTGLKNSFSELGYTIFNDSGIGVFVGGIAQLISGLVTAISMLVKFFFAINPVGHGLKFAGWYLSQFGELLNSIPENIDKAIGFIQKFALGFDFVKDTIMNLVKVYNKVADSMFGRGIGLKVIDTEGLEKDLNDIANGVEKEVETAFSGEQLDGMSAFNDVLSSTLGISEDVVSQLEKLTMLSKSSYGEKDGEYQRILNTFEQLLDLEDDALKNATPEHLEKLYEGYQTVIDNQELYLDLLAKGLSGDEAKQFLENLGQVEKEFDKLIESEEDRHEAFIDNIEAEKEKFKSVIDNQINEIKRFEDALQFESTIEDIMDERATLEKELLRLENDNSLEAEVRRRELANELADLEKELSEENRNRENELREEQLNSISDIVENELDAVMERADIEMELLQAKKDFLEDEVESLANYKEIVDSLKGSSYNLEDLVVAISKASGIDSVGSNSAAMSASMSSKAGENKLFDFSGASFSLSSEEANVLEKIFTNVLDGNKSSQIIRE